MAGPRIMSGGIHARWLPRRAWFARLLCLLALQEPAVSAEIAPALETGPCSLAGAAPATVALVDDDFDLLLDDGRRLALAGLEFPRGDGEAAALRAAALARLAGWLPQAQVFVEAFSAAPDRWSHTPAQAMAPASAEPDSPLISVGAALLAEGLVRFRPEPAAGPCAKTYLAAEKRARAEKRGVWAIDPLVDVSAASPAEIAALGQRKGMVVATGVVRSVGETKSMIYMNFGVSHGGGFAVEIFKKNAAIFESQGVFPRTLAGRQIGVRGLIDWNNGPRMEISTPAQLEIDAPDVR